MRNIAKFPVFPELNFGDMNTLTAASSQYYPGLMSKEDGGGIYIPKDPEEFIAENITHFEIGLVTYYYETDSQFSTSSVESYKSISDIGGDPLSIHDTSSGQVIVIIIYTGNILNQVGGVLAQKYHPIDLVEINGITHSYGENVKQIDIQATRILIESDFSGTSFGYSVPMITLRSYPSGTPNNEIYNYPRLGSGTFSFNLTVKKKDGTKTLDNQSINIQIQNS